jgi:hypothetical protein
MHCSENPPDANRRYESHSDRKLLIHIDFEVCFFCRQSNESLDLQGFAASQDKFSTKLSTETLDQLQICFKSST